VVWGVEYFVEDLICIHVVLSEYFFRSKYMYLYPSNCLGFFVWRSQSWLHPLFICAECETGLRTISLSNYCLCCIFNKAGMKRLLWA
jgi:hypothetical protein